VSNQCNQSVGWIRFGDGKPKSIGVTTLD
jgi:hypothetical protein